jgi:hypothetical protein
MLFIDSRQNPTISILLNFINKSFIGINLQKYYQAFNKFIQISKIDGSNAYNGSWTSNHAACVACRRERLFGL